MGQDIFITPQRKGDTSTRVFVAQLRDTLLSAVVK